MYVILLRGVRYYKGYLASIGGTRGLPRARRAGRGGCRGVPTRSGRRADGVRCATERGDSRGSVGRANEGGQHRGEEEIKSCVGGDEASSGEKRCFPARKGREEAQRRWSGGCSKVSRELTAAEKREDAAGSRPTACVRACVRAARTRRKEQKWEWGGQKWVQQHVKLREVLVRAAAGGDGMSHDRLLTVSLLLYGIPRHHQRDTRRRSGREESLRRGGRAGACW